MHCQNANVKINAGVSTQAVLGHGHAAPSPPHNGRTVAPEAILFESPCRAHPET